MKVGVALQCFFNYKQESGSVQCRPVPSLMYAATFSLETCNLDLILASEIWPPMLKDLELDIKCNFTKMETLLFLIKG